MSAQRLTVSTFSLRYLDLYWKSWHIHNLTSITPVGDDKLLLIHVPVTSSIYSINYNTYRKKVSVTNVIVEFCDKTSEKHNSLVEVRKVNAELTT